MIELRRKDFRYTAYFCEENIWWLAHDLVARGFDAGQMQVLLFSNPQQRVVLLNQRVAAQGHPVPWDYHVVLQASFGGSQWILDFDTRLDFASPYRDYLSNTFPPQQTLAPQYRAWVRCIPAQSYLARFYSDRSHMRGHLPDNAFPDYPFIHPPADTVPIQLNEYRNVNAMLDDGSIVQPLTAILADPA